MKHRFLSETIGEIKTGDLLAFRVRRYNTITSFFLLLFQKIFREKFSHVGVAVRLGDRVFIVEATMPKVQIVPISGLTDFYWVPTSIKTPETKQVDILLDYIGVKYSLRDLVTHYLGMSSSKNSMYCSEMASAFYYYVGYLHERESGHTPDKIAEAVLKRGGLEDFIYIVNDRGNL